MRCPLSRSLVLITVLLLFTVHLAASAEQTITPPQSDEEWASSSEQTVESSNEIPMSRRRRSLDGSADSEDATTSKARAAIPGLPDPATIIKISEILQTVGEKVIPILVEGNPATDIVEDRIGNDVQFLRSFKKAIDVFTNNLKAN